MPILHDLCSSPTPVPLAKTVFVCQHPTLTSNYDVLDPEHLKRWIQDESQSLRRIMQAPGSDETGLIVVADDCPLWCICLASASLVRAEMDERDKRMLFHSRV